MMRLARRLLRAVFHATGRRASLTLVVIIIALVIRPSAYTPSVTALLDQYLRGDFEAVVAALDATRNSKSLLNDLKDQGPDWIAAGGPAARDRRELAAATFALEAARADEWDEWKWRVRFSTAGETVYWMPPPLFIEWGCALFRKDENPRPIERIWQLAALAVAQRSEDFEFLIDDKIDLALNRKDVIEHLHHVQPRFPSEPRLKLAEGIAVEAMTWPMTDKLRLSDALPAFEGLLKDDDVGAEASLRLGAMHMRMSRGDARALDLFAKAKRDSRDPYVVYLAQYFTGQVQERQRHPADAERAYRSALTAAPGAESASVALATLLFTADRRTEAAAVIAAMHAARPTPVDPWRAYMDADDRFWPQLLASLRREILK